MSDQTQTIQYIPLNKLVASPSNVRRKHAKAEIESLSASIGSRGLLQNLCVVPAEEGTFEVVAGERRRLALKMLVKKKTIAKDEPIACHVVAHKDGVEVSLTENIHRVAMDAMDEVDAYAALVAEGKTSEEVARRFGVEVRHVDQRLALAGLSPKIKAAWKRGDITLDVARAFCLVTDHAQQDAVFRSLGRPITHPGSVRARLLDGRVRASDRLAVFVGLEAYESAGGKVLRDLFDAEGVFIEDPGLLAKLAEEKLAESRGEWLAKGWSWVEVNLGNGRGEGLSSTRLQPGWREPTAEESVELARLKADIEVLDAELEASEDDDDPRWSQRDDLEAEFETIRQAARCWMPEVMAMAGVVLTLDYKGEPTTTEGLVRSEDQKRVAAYLKQVRGETDADGNADADRDEDRFPASALPKAVNRDLTTVRTRAIRLLLSGEPDIALALCVSAMAHRSLHRAEMPGVAVSAQVRQLEDMPALDEAMSEAEGRLPSDPLALLDWSLGLSRETLLAVLAVLVAGAVDLTHEDATPADREKQDIADLLAQQLDLDMTRFWQPDVGFWARLPKTTLMTALADALATSGKSQRTCEDMLKAHGKLRKDDLAAKISAMFDGTGYLPDILTTPVAAGGVTVTPEGMAAIAKPAVAAE